MWLFAACAPGLTCGPGTKRAGDTCVPKQGEDDNGIDTEAPLEVYLLAGQSNMDGYSVYTGLPPSWRLGRADVPLYWSGWGAFQALAPASYGGVAYTGPEVGFGQTLADAGRSVALVKHAVGGTDLATYWNPGEDADDPDVGPGWATFVATMDAAALELDAAGRDWRWAGLIWMQGESDALDPDWAAAYQDNLTHFVARVREETGEPELPAVVGLIACDGLCEHLDEVRDAQEAVADADANVQTIETEDLPRNPLDQWHYDGPSMRVLGTRFAEAVLGEPFSAPPEAALTLTAGSTDYDGDFTVGWRLQTDRPLTVTDVGGYGGDYLYLSVEWGLWDTATQALIARGTLPGWYDAPTSWRGGFWYTAVEPFELPAGDYIFGLVSWSADGNQYVHDATGVEGPGVAYVEARYHAGSWLTFPETAADTAGMSFLGPSFLYTE